MERRLPGQNFAPIKRWKQPRALNKGWPGIPAEKLAFGKSRPAHYKAQGMTMNRPAIAILSAMILGGCSDQSSKVTDVTAAPWECISAKVTIGTNAIDTVVRYNKVNGEAQLLNAASFASKATGAQGNIVGWVPLGDLKNAVQELMAREQAAQQQIPAAPEATPEATPEAKKK